MKTRILPLAGLLLLAAVATAVALPGAATSAAAEEGGITVQGTASVTSVPDRAELSFGVESQGETARAALAANAAEMRRVLAALRSAGATNVKTQYVSLSPRYDERSQAQGFTATNSVSATVKDLARAGAVIDAAVAAGANQVHGPSLAAGDPTALYRQALKAALDEARTKAQTLAAASGLSLGRVTAIVEGGGGPQPLPFAVADKAAAESTPIEPGTQQVSATVSVTFSIS
jgi:uncharacterized protein YggE